MYVLIYYEWMSVQVFPPPAWNRPKAICGIHTPIQPRVTSTTCLSNYTDDTLVNSILFAITQHHKIAGPTRLFMGQKFSRQMAKKAHWYASITSVEGMKEVGVTMMMTTTSRMVCDYDEYWRNLRPPPFTIVTCRNFWTRSLDNSSEYLKIFYNRFRFGLLFCIIFCFAIVVTALNKTK